MRQSENITLVIFSVAMSPSLQRTPKTTQNHDHFKQSFLVLKMNSSTKSLNVWKRKHGSVLLFLLLNIKRLLFFGPFVAPPEVVIKPIWKDNSHISISKCIFLLLVEYRYDLTSILTFFGVYRDLTLIGPFWGHLGSLQALFLSLFQQLTSTSAFLKLYY